jgi:hypothetical protein
MGTRGGELITADEPTVIAKLSLYPIVVKNSQGDGGLANPSGTSESDWNRVLSEIYYILDQLVASEERPWWQRRGFSGYARFECQMMGPFTV